MRGGGWRVAGGGWRAVARRLCSCGARLEQIDCDSNRLTNHRGRFQKDAAGTDLQAHGSITARICAGSLCMPPVMLTQGCRVKAERAAFEAGCETGGRARGDDKQERH